MATLLHSVNIQAPSPCVYINSPIKPFNPYYFVTFKCYTRNCSLYSHLPPTLSHINKNKFMIFASSGTEDIQQPEIQNNTVGDAPAETEEGTLSNDDGPEAEESPTSPVISALQLYKKAFSDSDVSTIAELEKFFKTIEDEKNGLETKVASLSEDLSVEKERVLRISADFDNFRKRTERERLSLVTNAKGEVIENFLPVLDNFERAKSQIKIGSREEEKISNSYQSIYKQFIDILNLVGVVPVETVGKPFDPLLHEAIMREDSAVYEEGVIIEEYRKGFKLGDRLLRPSMVKVSAGPGSEKPEISKPAVKEEGAAETGQVADGTGDGNV